MYFHFHKLHIFSDLKPIVQDLGWHVSNGQASNEVIDSAVIIHNDFLDFVVPESMMVSITPLATILTIFQKSKVNGMVWGGPGIRAIGTKPLKRYFLHTTAAVGPEQKSLVNLISP